MTKLPPRVHVRGRKEGRGYMYVKAREAGVKSRESLVSTRTPLVTVMCAEMI